MPVKRIITVIVLMTILFVTLMAQLFKYLEPTQTKQIVCESGLRIKIDMPTHKEFVINNNALTRITVTDYAAGEALIVLGNCGVMK